MLKRSYLVLLPVAALASLTGGVASAAAQGTAGDAKCFLVSNMFAKSSDAKARAAAERASFFYLGRLGGSSAQVQAALAAAGPGINQKNAGATMEGCARTVEQKTVEMRAIGQRLSAAAPKSKPK